MTSIQALRAFGSLVIAVAAATAPTLHSSDASTQGGAARIQETLGPIGAPTALTRDPAAAPGDIGPDSLRISQPEPLFSNVTLTNPTSTQATSQREPWLATLTISDRVLASDAIVNADAHILNLLPDMTVVALRNRVEMRPHGDYSWFGTIPDDRYGRAIVTVVAGKFGAFVVYRGRNLMVLPLKDTLYKVIDIGSGDFLDSDIPPVADIAPPDVPTGMTSRTTRAVGTGTVDIGGLIRWFDLSFAAREGNAISFNAEDAGGVIDILVLYTEPAVQDTGLAEMVNRIQTGIDAANLGLWQSGIPTRFNLLFNTGLLLDQLMESGRMETDILVWKVHPAVTSLRDAMAADIVVFVTTDVNDLGGRGLSSGEMVAVGATAHPDTYLHELGHSMGLMHDWYACVQLGECPLPSNGWELAHANHGYIQFFGELTSAVRTIMTYPNECLDLKIPLESCQRLARFSNARINENGQPFGIPQGEPWPSDEVGVLNDGRLFDIANRRQSVCRLLSSC